MKNLVRGAAVFTVLTMVAIFIFAQVNTDAALVNANDSQSNLINNNSITDNFLTNNISAQPATEQVFTEQEYADDGFKYSSDDDDKDKKLVKKTGMVTAAGAGASKGAFNASAYCFSGRTAMGHSVRRGLIAADPRVLKLGSKVYINAGQWSGTYLVSDTGGAIKGKRIDIWVPGCSEARKFGRRTVQIYAVQ